MERLPTEMLGEVFESLSNKDVLNLPPHIIAHALGDARAQKMLQRLDLWLGKSSLERLNGISRYPNLAKHVKEIRFYNERLDDISAEAYLKSFWITNHGSEHHGILEKLSFSNYRELAFKGNLSVEEPFIKYRKLLDNQTRMEEQHEDVLLLEATLAGLLNLRKFSIDNINRFGLSDILGDAWCRGVEQNPLENCGSHLLEVLFGVMSTTKKITSFEVLCDAVSYSGGINTINFPAMLSILTSNTISSAVQNLRSLELNRFYFGVDEIKSHDSVREENCDYYWKVKKEKGEKMKNGSPEAIAGLLRSAPLLETLTLKCHEFHRRIYRPLLIPYMPLQSMRGSNDLQHLKRLSLANFRTRRNQLVPFLLKVASTLTSIHIENIVLESGSWLSAFSMLRGRFPHLERFKVGFDDLYEGVTGVDEIGTKRPGRIIKASDVEVSNIEGDILFDFGNNDLLRWFKDGTGTNPTLLAMKRRNPLHGFCQYKLSR